MPVTLCHFVLWRDREGDAAIDEGLELCVRKIVAVHDVDVRPDQAAAHQLFPAAGSLGLAAALVHRRHEAELAGEGEVVGADLQGRIVRPEDRDAERDQRSAVGERAFQQALDLATRMRHLGEVRFARLRVGLRRAMEERGADAAFLERRHAGIGMGRRRVVVRPVDEGRDAMVELVQRPGQGGDVDVFGREYGRQPGVHVAKIF